VSLFAGPFEDAYAAAYAAYTRGDYAATLQLLMPLAARGNAAAQSRVGSLYDNGEGVPKDYNEAIKWYRLAAAQGDEFAQNNLGVMYANGRAVPQDYGEAIKWYRLAAAHGDAQGQANLGAVYANGRGVPQDDKEAVKWFRLAAAQGNQLALGDLGLMYAYGQGVPKDYVLSYMWLTVGKGNVAVVVSEMTSAQIAQALIMAKRCEESAYQQCGEPRDDLFGFSLTSVPMQIEGGIYVVPVLINDAITLDFVVDSGAADVSIPADVVMTLMRTKTLKGTDFLGEKTYVLADGSKVPSQTFVIRSLKVGNKVLENVNGSIASVQGSPLLGQSFLNRFKSWSVDNANHALVLSE
jgi:predicted aspartyl protease